MIEVEITHVSPYNDFNGIALDNGDYLVLETSEEFEVGDTIFISDLGVGHVEFIYDGIEGTGEIQACCSESKMLSYLDGSE